LIPQSAYSTRSSPSTPEAYGSALASQYPINANTDGQPRPALAIAGYGRNGMAVVEHVDQAVEQVDAGLPGHFEC
jgi:hypothetical protein